MKEKISQLAKEKFEYEKPDLKFSVETLKFTVEVPRSVQATFQITNTLNLPMKGLVYSTDKRLIIEENTFVGQSAEIVVTYDAIGETLDTAIKNGTITAVSNFGEYELPFEVQLEAPSIQTSYGKVHELEEFVELAKKDYAEAIAVFTTPEFRKLILKKETDKRLYDGLLQSPVQAQAMEQFLIAAKCKPRVTLVADNEEKQYEDVATSMSDAMEIMASGWGYFEALVSTDCDFIVLGQKTLTSDEFVEGSCMLPYTIDYSRVIQTSEKGQIRIETVNQTLIVTVTVTKVTMHSQRVKDTPVFERKKLEMELVQTYLKFRLNQLSKEAYGYKLEETIERLLKVDPSIMGNLWLAHYYMVVGRTDKLDFIMQHLEEREVEIAENEEYYCAYRYLKVLYTKNGMLLEETKQLFWSRLEEDQSSWRLLWYLLYIDGTFEEDQERRLAAVIAMLKQGACSPIMYFEAAFAYNKEPQLLTELAREERQIMHWAIRNRFLSKELANQFVFVASRVKRFDPLILQDLMVVYEYMQGAECLQVILRMLIIGQMTDASYFKWYELGVKNNLKLTELYEYYMYSLKEDSCVEIDRTVLLYFVYNNHLPEAKKAFLYAYILKNKEKDGSIYRTYLRQIESFTRKMALKGAVSASLVPLYQEFITPDVVDEELAKTLPQILFRYELTCQNKKITSIVVRQEEYKEETRVSLEDGRCLFTMPTSHATIYLLDAKRNRYVEEDAYTIRRPFYDEQLIAACYRINKQNLSLLLAQREGLLQTGVKEQNAADRYMVVSRILESEEISREFKNRHLVTMMEYYYNLGEHDKLDTMLKELNLAKVEEEDIPVVAEYMIMRGQLDKAYKMVRLYGSGIVTPKQLQVIVEYFLKTYLCREKETTKNPWILSVCEQLVEDGCRDQDILTYLALHYEDTTRNVYRCYQLLKQEGIDTLVLQERLLAQMLFSGTMLEESKELFLAFYEESNNKMLIRAYLNYMAYRFVRFDEAISEELCERMKRESFYHESRVGILAVLKFNVKKEAFTEEEYKFIDYNLHKFIGEGIVLPFFKEYGDRIHLPDELMNHYYIEYKGSPEDKVKICYCSKDGMPMEEAVMKNMFEGIFVKGFVLFYKETLQYFMQVDKMDGTTVTTTAKVLTPTKIDGPRNHFEELNQMSKAFEDRDSTVLQKLLKEYAIEDYITSSVFTPL